MTLPFFGVTIGTKGPPLNPQAIKDMQELGMGNGKGMLRFQVPWSQVEPSRGNYNFSLWNDAIKRCKDAGIKVCLTIKQPPAFWRLPDNMPSPQGTLLLACEVARRYGKDIDVLHVGNEDYDNSANIHFAALANTMRAVYDPVKQINPALQIWPGALLQRNLSKQKQKIEILWQEAAGCFDAISVHPYTGLPNGADIDPRNEDQGNIPGFRRCIEQINEINASFGHADFPVVVDEFGFAVTANFGRPAWQVVSEEEQETFLFYCYNEGLRLGVGHMSLFTLAYATPSPEGMSIVQANGRRTPAFLRLKPFVAEHSENPEPDPGNGGGDPDPDPTGPTGEQIALARAKIAQAKQLMSEADTLLSPQ